jgi:hypothetical protein
MRRHAGRTARFGVEALERRDTPSSLVTVPGVLRGFNPQPEPPGTLRSAPAEVSSPEEGTTRSIIIVSG